MQKKNDPRKPSSLQNESLMIQRRDMQVTRENGIDNSVTPRSADARLIINIYRGVCMLEFLYTTIMFIVFATMATNIIKISDAAWNAASIGRYWMKVSVVLVFTSVPAMLRRRKWNFQAYFLDWTDIRTVCFTAINENEILRYLSPKISKKVLWSQELIINIVTCRVDSGRRVMSYHRRQLFLMKFLLAFSFLRVPVHKIQIYIKF